VFASLSRKLFEKLQRKGYRHAYVAEHARTGIAFQIRAMREQREWLQKKLSQEMHKPQSVVSRLEDPDYGKANIQTLLEVAAAFDVALLIQFVSFPEFLRRTRDVSPSALMVDSFDPKQLVPAMSITAIAKGDSSPLSVVVSYGYEGLSNLQPSLAAISAVSKEQVNQSDMPSLQSASQIGQIEKLVAAISQQPQSQMPIQ
jgi:hypothetical protein